MILLLAADPVAEQATIIRPVKETFGSFLAYQFHYIDQSVPGWAKSATELFKDVCAILGSRFMEPFGSDEMTRDSAEIETLSVIGISLRIFRISLALGKHRSHTTSPSLTVMDLLPDTVGRSLSAKMNFLSNLLRYGNVILTKTRSLLSYR